MEGNGAMSPSAPSKSVGCFNEALPLWKGMVTEGYCRLTDGGRCFNEALPLWKGMDMKDKV